jgi:hypothetical protein
VFGSQEVQLTERLDINCIQVDVEGQSPLAVFERIMMIAGKVISECFKRLKCRVILPYTLNTEDVVATAQLTANATATAAVVPAMFVSLQAVREVAENDKKLRARGNFVSKEELEAKYSPWLLNQGALASYDLFVSYRWGKYDGEFVEKLVDVMRQKTVSNDNNRSVHVFRDTIRLQLGEQFQSAFVTALVNSTVFVPILSRDALARMETHNPEVADNVLVEWWCAFIVHSTESSSLKSVMPLMFGPRINDEAANVGNLFADGIVNRLPKIVPTKTIEIGKALLQKVNIATPIESESWTVKQIVDQICGFLGKNVWEMKKKTVGGLAKECAIDIHKAIEKHTVAKVNDLIADVSCVVNAMGLSAKIPSSTTPNPSTGCNWDVAFQLLEEEKVVSNEIKDLLASLGIDDASDIEVLEPTDIQNIASLMRKAKAKKFLAAVNGN